VKTDKQSHKINFGFSNKIKQSNKNLSGLI